MTAILQTLGPVSTSVALRSNWKFLKSSTVPQFFAAGQELEKLGLGSLVQLSGGSLKVFVKNNPSDVQHILEAHPEICQPHLYDERYHRPATKMISWKIRSRLIDMGLVSEKQFM